MWGIRHHDDPHHPDPDSPCLHHDHAMVFHSCVCAEILFSGWSTTNAVQLFGSAVAVFLASVLYEAFKCYRDVLTNKPDGELSDSQMNLAKAAPKKGMLTGSHAIQTMLHMVQSTVSYLLMLVFMTYNVWLCLAVVLGLTFGYFLFGWRRGSGPLNDGNEHCQ